MSAVADFYNGRSLLVTGATGFMGKVLVEKLLRSCPGVERIYLLMRPKRGQSAQERLNEMLNSKVFESLKKNQSECLSKLVSVEGDITMPEMGLSEEDKKVLCESVSIVFHSAATVKFDEALKLSVAMNLTGTKKLLALCHKMVKLEALVHVSTAYCNCNRTEVFEQVYPPPADPERIMQLVEVLDEPLLETITPQILNGLPNTYTFTKALAEHLMMEEGGILPIAIVRPSIVSAAWKEPMPGWVDNLNGPTGIIAAVGKGVLRSLLCHRDKIADLIPVDIAINFLITVAWYTATVRPNSTLVYNCTSSTTNPLFWKDIETVGHKAMIRHPFSDVMWYPGGSFKNNRLAHKLCMAVFHMVPAYIYDFTAWLTGKKPILVRVQKKLQKAINSLQFFLINEFRFHNENMMKLLQYLQPEDKLLFDFDIRSLNWNKYIEIYVLGTRKYILKEEMSTLETAKGQLRRMFWLEKITQFVIAALLWKFLLMKSETMNRTWRYLLLFMVQSFKSFAGAVPQLSL